MVANLSNFFLYIVSFFIFMGVDWEIINTIELSIKYLNKGMKLVSRGSIGVEMFR